MAFTQITVTATFANADGSIPSGTVIFTPTAPMANNGSTVPMVPKVLTLQGGTGSVVLDANDDAGTVPSGTGYTVTEQISGASPRVYAVVLAKASPSVALSNLAPATTTAIYNYVLLDSTGKVTLSQIPDLSATYALVAEPISAAETTRATAAEALKAPLASPALTGTPTIGGKHIVKADDLFFNIKDYGAVIDGATDDGAAIRSAVTAANAAKGIVYFPPGTAYYKATGNLSLSAGVKLLGVPGSSIINLDPSTPAAYTEFVRNNGDGVTVEGLTVKRVSDFPCVMFPVQAFSGMVIRDCTFNGQRDIYTTNYCHGIQTGVNNAGISDRTLIIGSTFTKMSFPLFQDNASTATVRNLTVRDCVFDTNYATDLEFNAPNGTQTDTLVTGCQFRNNQNTTAGAGFGVGIAHLTRATVRDCTFNLYPNEAIHIEDFSTMVTVEGNRFVACGTSQGSYIQVISGASDVRIANNSIDATANSNFIKVINCLQGGGGLTPGGRTSTPPTEIHVIGNRILAGSCHGIYIETTLKSVISHNRLVGSSSVSGGVFSGANGGNAINMYDGADNICDHNLIRGFGFAFALRTDSIIAWNNGSVISNNMISNCNYGIGAANCGPAVINGNMIFNCVHPFVLGQGNSAPFPVLASGNHAYGCKYVMEIGGVVIVISNGAASIGSGVSLTVLALPLRIPSGTVITFSGGGVLTLTSTGTAGATSITGNLATANIASAETATVTGIAYSTVGAQNHALLTANADSVAGNY